MSSQWNRFRREVVKGKLHHRTSLNALAEQAEKLAAVQEDAASATEDEKAAEVLNRSAGIMRGLASNLQLHALTHLGDDAQEIDKEEAARLLAKMPKQ